MNLLKRKNHNKLTWVSFKGQADLQDGKILIIDITIPVEYLALLHNETTNQYYAEMLFKTGGWLISKETYEYLLKKANENSIFG